MSRTLSKDPKRVLEEVGEEAQRKLADMTDEAVSVLREGLSPEARGEIPYRDRRAAAEYLLDYVLPGSPNKQPGDGMTVQLLNQDGRAMALFIQQAGELERIPHELKDVTPVERDPHLVPAGESKPEEEGSR